MGNQDKKRVSGSRRVLSPAEEAVYEVSIMLGEVDFKNKRIDASIVNFLKALKLRFSAELFNLIISLIPRLERKKQDDFYYSLGKILLVNCGKKELAKGIFNEISRRDVDYIRKIHLLLIEETSNYKEGSKKSLPADKESASDPEIERMDSVSKKLRLEIAKNSEEKMALDPEAELHGVETILEDDDVMEAFNKLSLLPNLKDSLKNQFVPMDKNKVKDLMDSLLE